MVKVCQDENILFPLIILLLSIPLMSRNACKGENGGKSPEDWRFELDAKSGPLETGDLGKIGERWR